MLSSTANETPRSRLAQNPAVCAWSRLRPNCAELREVQLLKRSKKSAVLRLVGAGQDGTSVIAKRCAAATCSTERVIYEDVLPRLPLPALRCFGSVEAWDKEFHWLFIEDAGREPYLPNLEEHRAAAARWLARVHMTASGIDAASRLPGRGACFYLEQLRLARNNLRQAFTNPALNPRELAVLEQIIILCSALESRWEQIEAYCREIPPTFVHGDFKAKNIRIRRNGDGIALLTFDWEIAGWGVPAVDLLKCPDLRLYCSELKEHWQFVRASDLERLAEVGAVFRTLIAIYWKSLALKYPWVEWPVGKLRLYLRALRQSMDAVGIA